MKINKIDLNKSILEQLEENYPEEAKNLGGYRNVNTALWLLTLKLNSLIDKIEKKEEKRNEKKEELLDLLDRLMETGSSSKIVELSQEVLKIIKEMRREE